MSSIPPEAAVGFQRGAADYERGRPGYPEAAIALLARELGIGPGRVVMDLAAGTGKLTRALVGLGADVVAVEPVTGMREQLIRAVPDAQVLDGTAERLPVADASVDAVLVAQAFHWFDIPAAAAEIHRALVPGGGLAVVRNEWDESVPWVVELRALIAEHAGEPPHRHARGWRSALEATGLFTPMREEVFAHPVEVDLESLQARVASLSYVAMMEGDARGHLLGAVADLARERGLVAADGHIAHAPTGQARVVVPAPRGVTPELRDALAADRAIRRRAAREAIPLPAGLALRHPGLADVHYLNAVLLDPGPYQLDPDSVVAEADRWLGDLGHRHVVFDDADAGEAAAGRLVAEGWERSRTVYMVFATDPSTVPADPRARLISETEMQGLQLAGLRAEAPEVDARPGLVERLVATQTALRASHAVALLRRGRPRPCGWALMCYALPRRGRQRPPGGHGGGGGDAARPARPGTGPRRRVRRGRACRSLGRRPHRRPRRRR